MQNGQKIRRMIFGGWAAFVVLVCLWPTDHANMPMSLAMCGIFLLLIGTIWFICEKFAPLPGADALPVSSLKLYAPFYSILMMAALARITSLYAWGLVLLVGFFCWARDYRQASNEKRRILRCVLLACLSAVFMVFDVVSYPFGVVLTLAFWCGMLYLAAAYTRRTAEKHSQTMLLLWDSMFILSLVLGMAIFIKFLLLGGSSAWE